MDFHLMLWLIAISSGAAMVGGVLGMSGGIFIVPILTLFGRIDIHVAIGASIVSVIACSCGSAAAYLKERLTNIRLALLLEVATTLGALTGVLIAGIIPTSVLYFLFGSILMISAYQMLARRSEATASPDGRSPLSVALRLNSFYPDKKTGKDVEYHVHRVPIGLALMYGAGVISALLGIGSGVLKLPAMDTALKLPIKVSSATSNFMIGVTAAASAGAYFVRGNILPEIAGPIAVGSVIGAAAGVRILVSVSNERIRVLFVGVILLLAVQMQLTAFGFHFRGIN